jgi:hypothetical protein
MRERYYMVGKKKKALLDIEKTPEGRCEEICAGETSVRIRGN